MFWVFLKIHDGVRDFTLVKNVNGTDLVVLASSSDVRLLICFSLLTPW